MDFSNYSNLYSISKTLRWELKPFGETLDYIRKRGIINIDEEKYIDSFKVKKLLDEFYCIKIDGILSNIIFKQEDINEYILNLNNKDNLKKIIEKLKIKVIDEFKKNNFTKDMTTVKVFNELNQYLKSQNRNTDIDILKKYFKYGTYFLNFFKSREFIFCGKDIGSISYRLIEENLPIFLENIKIFSKIYGTGLENDCSSYLNEELFNNTLEFKRILTQEGIDYYNYLIIGKSKEDGTQEKGLNVLINLYNQKNKTKHAILKPVNKMILSERNTFSFVIDKINSDEEVFFLIEEYLRNVIFKNLFISDNIDLEKVHIKYKDNFKFVSNKIFADWNFIQDSLNEWYEKEINSKIENKTFLEKRKKYFSNISSYSIKKLNDVTKANIFNKLKLLSDQYINDIKLSFNEYKKINKEELKNIKDDNNVVKIIKDLLDNLKSYQLFLNNFYLPEKNIERDPDFYNGFDLDYENIINITSIYDKIRNYLTKKPFSIEKFKINFNCPTLLSGWDINKEDANLGVILRKINNKTNKYDYYLGIIQDKKVFDNEASVSENVYEKMEYKLFPDPSKQLPRLFISAKDYNKKLSQEFKGAYEAKKYTKDNIDKKIDRKFLKEYIEYMQKNLKDRYSEYFDFNFRNPGDYAQVDEFYREVEAQAYSVKFKNYDKEYINKCVEEGKLYLFQIYSKDFSEFSKGLPNNQTIYFDTLFSKENILDKNFRLNGGGEIFYRKRSLEYKETHLANVPIKNKTLNYHNEYNTFNYPLVKDKRYTKDKFLFHFPITINAVNSNTKNINTLINEDIDKFEYVIGIDRGERNLIYIVMTDLKGNIEKQISLNTIINQHKGRKYETDYHTLLDNREKALKDERKAWKEIETIKELKEGYISQVVNKIKELVIEYKALVVLENLNYGFKKSRIKIEKQVYQKLETQLINKLNYVIDKENSDTYLNGLQLTNKISTLDKIGSQSGIVLYIPAWNTSKIDPTTGFVNLIFGLKYKNENDTKELISKIKDIRFNGNYFEFDIDFNDYNPYYKETKTSWTVCTYGTRIETFIDEEQNSSWVSKEIDLTSEFIKLFEEYNVDTTKPKESLLNINKAEFYKNFIRLFKLMLQIRNSDKENLKDYLLSPVKNKNGEFFDSREADNKMPQDADANGAYNIARKGIMLIERIKNTPCGKKPDYKITNEEYLQKLQNL